MREVSRYRLYGARDRILLGLWSKPLGIKEALQEIREIEEAEENRIWVQHNGKWRVAPSQTKRYWWE